MMNHIAGYLQPVPMWALFTGAFIDTWSKRTLWHYFYFIGLTPYMACDIMDISNGDSFISYVYWNF
eukprot:UN09756